MLKDFVHEWLTQYQRDFIVWGQETLPKHKGIMAHWECGSGKTAASWALACHLKYRSREGQVVQRPILVVTRANAKIQWYNEIKNLSDAKVNILQGQAPTKWEMMGYDALIINWEILPHWAVLLVKWIHHGVIIFDEIHIGKSYRRFEKYLNPNTNLLSTRLSSNVVGSASKISKAAVYRIGLSATPIRNTRMDLWGELDLLQPGQWGISYKFGLDYCDGVENKWGGLDTKGTSNTKQLKRKLKPIWSRVTMEDFASQMPSKRRDCVYATASELNKAAAFAATIRKAKTKKSVFELKLAQAASRKHKIIQELTEDAVRCNQKIVVLTGRKAECDKIGDLLKEKYKGEDKPKARDPVPRCDIIVGHGDHSPEARAEMCANYMSHPGPVILVGTYDAWGESLNMQDTDLALVAMLPYTPGQVTQLEGRFARLGQKRPVYIRYIIAEGTVDEHVANILLSKLDIVEKTLQDKEAGEISKTLSGFGTDEEILEDILSKF